MVRNSIFSTHQLYYLSENLLCNLFRSILNAHEEILKFFGSLVFVFLNKSLIDLLNLINMTRLNKHTIILLDLK